MNIENIITELKKDSNALEKSEIIDSVIALQLQKIIDYNSSNKNMLSEFSEAAMHNLIELIKLR